MAAGGVTEVSKRRHVQESQGWDMVASRHTPDRARSWAEPGVVARLLLGWRDGPALKSPKGWDVRLHPGTYQITPLGGFRK